MQIRDAARVNRRCRRETVPCIDENRVIYIVAVVSSYVTLIRFGTTVVR